MKSRKLRRHSGRVTPRIFLFGKKQEINNLENNINQIGELNEQPTDRGSDMVEREDSGGRNVVVDGGGGGGNVVVAGEVIGSGNKESFLSRILKGIFGI